MPIIYENRYHNFKIYIKSSFRYHQNLKNIQLFKHLYIYLQPLKFKMLVYNLEHAPKILKSQDNLWEDFL